MRSEVAQTSPQIVEPAVPVAAPIHSQAGWGIFGAVATVLIQRGFAWAGQKDRNEAAIVDRLLTTLIDSLNNKLDKVTHAVESLSDNLSKVVEAQNARIDSLEDRVENLERKK